MFHWICLWLRSFCNIVAQYHHVQSCTGCLIRDSAACGPAEIFPVSKKLERQTDHRETVRDNHRLEMAWRGEVISQWTELLFVTELGSTYCVGNLLGHSFRRLWVFVELLTHGRVRCRLARG